MNLELEGGDVCVGSLWLWGDQAATRVCLDCLVRLRCKLSGLHLLSLELCCSDHAH